MFNNEVVVITGGSSGLGLALAHKFVAAGASVALVARDTVKLAAAEQDLAAQLQSSQRVMSFACDVACSESCERVMESIAGALGAPTLLINSAGILHEGYFEQLSPEIWRSIIDINLMGTVNTSRAILPYFARRGGGRIVNVASLAGKFGTFGYTAYCASKHAVVGFTECLRLELGPRNIKVQLVCPGEFDTPMVEGIAGSRTPENKALTHTVPPMSLAAVTDETFAGIVKGTYLIIPGWIGRCLYRLGRWAPGLVSWIMDRQLKAVYRGPSHRQ
ncbi:MAG: SDR family oxidoreductase [Rhodocyclaceae bacterium]|nr:SDR family oxidoreductase [Rhodocyclaceae bacterium]